MFQLVFLNNPTTSSVFCCPVKTRLKHIACMKFRGKRVVFCTLYLVVIGCGWCDPNTRQSLGTFVLLFCLISSGKER